jgi:hypothetical protein
MCPTILWIHKLLDATRMGDLSSFQEFIEQMIEGESEVQYILERYTSKLPFSLLTEMASRILAISDDKALLLVSALQRPNLLPREIGPILSDSTFEEQKRA